MNACTCYSISLVSSKIDINSQNIHYIYKESAVNNWCYEKIVHVQGVPALAEIAIHNQ